MKRLPWPLLLAISTSAPAGDTATELLARIRQSGQAKFQYQETRLLELADSPWQGQGYMLTDADGSLVKLQQQPTRVIMAIAGDSMIYWDPAQNQRHTAPLGYGGPAAQQILVFRSILQGRTEELQAIYDFTAETRDSHWRLRLTPKPEHTEAGAPSIDISGDSDPDTRRILIQQADGESTEYRISKAGPEQAADYSIPRLLKEATGE